MYRGKDIGNREQFVRNCLHLMRAGQPEQLFDLLPHLSLVRDDSFAPTLFRMLRSPDRTKVLFAAMALGSIGDPSAIHPLREIFLIPETVHGEGSRELQEAIIVSLGQIDHPDGVTALVEILGTAPVDEFSAQRTELVIASLGSLAQLDIREAEETLYTLLDSDEAPVRALATLEIGVSYWHRPGSFSKAQVEKVAVLMTDPSTDVRLAAIDTLKSLAELGNVAAETAVRPNPPADTGPNDSE